ncbi:MAG: C4-type zinc ribbon domain-containing protein [Gordonia sp. (in: high G+C Gram-positive bacteria)]|uniref:zinc ribbon domain-containing protein n=1 Tax=Gordonia sp. (in: high G+C Gram-positive bacteria) TaxID=84139 RepID=UPI0039E395B1
MKAAPAHQRELLDLADLDAQIARTRHLLNNLPEVEQLLGIDERLEVAKDDVARAEVAVADLQREYEKTDAELTGMTEHAQRDQAQLDSGALSHKALTELQHEMSGLARRRDALESELLETMEQQEATGAELDRAKAAVEELTVQRADTEAARETSSAETAGKLDDLTGRRETIVADLPPELVTAYDRLRTQGRVGAGLVRQRRCGACRLELDPVTLGRIAAAGEDDVLFCEECGAIMVRTEQSGLPSGPKAE